MLFHEIIYLILSMVTLDTNVIGNFAIQFHERDGVINLIFRQAVV